MEKKPPQRDVDLKKGAVEDDSPHRRTQHDDSNTSMRGQLGHRYHDDMISGNDSDYPEPGENPEHSGEPEEKKDPLAS
jgi:hypothetical protein